MTIPASPLTRESVLAAILAGDRTEKQVAERLGIPLPDKDSVEWAVRPFAVWHLLNALHCADLLYMKVVGREWHYLPTRRATADQNDRVEAETGDQP